MFLYILIDNVGRSLLTAKIYTSQSESYCDDNDIWLYFSLHTIVQLDAVNTTR